MKQGHSFEAEITGLAYGGKAICKIENLVVFLKNGIPGQKVRAVITKNKKSYCEAKILEVIKPSSLEIKAKCVHFGTCGGCTWQNLKYDDQVKFKKDQVIDCLRSSGKTDKVKPCIHSPKVFSYRNKVELSFGYQSMKVHTDKTGNKTYEDTGDTLGFHKKGKFQEIVEVRNCDLISEKANKVINEVKNWCLSQKNLKVYNPYSRKGTWRHLLIRENLKGEIMTNLIIQDSEIKSKESEIGNYFSKLSDILKKLNVISFFVTINNGMNDDWSDCKPILIHGNDHIEEEILDLKFKISPKSFFQTNSSGAEILYSAVENYCNTSLQKEKDNLILDLYCGTGTIGQIIAKNSPGAKVIGIEEVESAVEDAKKNAKLNGIKNCEFICGKTEDILPALLKDLSIGITIIDPPRSGMHKKALKSILDSGSKHIIYVSCNPSTFARDLEILSQRYTLTDLQPVDMFPQTAHIEVVGKFELFLKDY